jgi:hypothetical protein
MVPAKQNTPNAAQIGNDFFANMLAEQAPQDAYKEFKAFKDLLNMHAGRIAAQQEFGSLTLVSESE